MEEKKQKLYYIYQLIDPRDNKVFYVGKGVDKRMYIHYQLVKYDKKILFNKHLYNKMKQLINENYKPIYKKVFETYDEQEAYNKEKNIIKEIGLENLCNIHEGGVGTTTNFMKKLWQNDHYRNKTVEAQKNYGAQKCWESRRLNCTDKHTDETKEKISQKQKGKESTFKNKHHSEESKNKLSESLKKFHQENPEAAINHSLKLTGRIQSDEEKEKRANSLRGQKRSEEIKKKMSESAKKRKYSESGLKKISESIKKRFENPEYTEKIKKSAKNRPKQRCKYCGRDVDVNTINRWHNENCKYKKNVK